MAASVGRNVRILAAIVQFRTCQWARSGRRRAERLRADRLVGPVGLAGAGPVLAANDQLAGELAAARSCRCRPGLRRRASGRRRPRRRRPGCGRWSAGGDHLGERGVVVADDADVVGHPHPAVGEPVQQPGGDVVVEGDRPRSPRRRGRGRRPGRRTRTGRGRGPARRARARAGSQAAVQAGAPGVVGVAVGPGEVDQRRGGRVRAGAPRRAPSPGRRRSARPGRRPTSRLVTTTGTRPASSWRQASDGEGRGEQQPVHLGGQRPGRAFLVFADSSDAATNRAYPSRRASCWTALMITAENELAMSGTTMPRLPVRRRASERATGFGA